MAVRVAREAPRRRVDVDGFVGGVEVDGDVVVVVERR